MIDFCEVANGETWELFSRDFLTDLGFSVAEPPDRGADGGRDMLLVEHLHGPLGDHDLRWLVSCKHNARARGQRSVVLKDEPNILDRVRAFETQGFLGMYSTLASAGLGRKLSQLLQRGELASYRILDHKLIENHLLQAGSSHLVARYFPESYRRIKPLHAIASRYEPLPCVVCGDDLLEAMYEKDGMSLVQYATETVNGHQHIKGLYWSCKGSCADAVQQRIGNDYAGWHGLDDLTIPALYLTRVLAILNRMKAGETYSDSALEQQKNLLIALGQRVFRMMTAEDRRRTAQAMTLMDLGL